MLLLGLNGGLISASGPSSEASQGYLHDASACLLQEGQTLAAVEEERLNRLKKTDLFPVRAIQECLDIAGKTLSSIDAVCYYFEESFLDVALNKNYLANRDQKIKYARARIVEHLKSSFDFDLPDDKLFFVPHHVAHASSSFVRSGFRDALVVVIDGAGEDHSGTIFNASAAGLKPLATHSARNSLGAFYLHGTQMLGYTFGDEYKVMGLAPYGDKGRYGEIFESLFTLKPNGDYTLENTRDLNIGLTGYNFIAPAFLNAGFFPRRRNEPFTQLHADFAAGLQATLEKIILHVLKYWSQELSNPNLCFSGGVAHNSTLNGAILASNMFPKVFVHPASHDAGSAEGAALAVESKLSKGSLPHLRITTASLGPDIGSPAAISSRLDSWTDVIEFHRADDIVEESAGLLAEGAVIGWVQGRSEFGPRALGNRSILADARPGENKAKINDMVKKRESYRPFAPAVTSNAAKKYFDLPTPVADYRYMSFVVPVAEAYQSTLRATTHIDHTARVQIVYNDGYNELFHRLITRFGQLTGVPVLLNTSFNNNFEPIVQTIDDAVSCFLTTSLDVLVAGEYVVKRRYADESNLALLCPSLRKTTKLATETRIAGLDELSRRYFLQSEGRGSTGSEISEEIYNILQCADGRTPLNDILDRFQSVGDRSELIQETRTLWDRRLLDFRPAARGI
ncbi:carbamoyltransferase family protein [Amycolatopsis pithecellobii]|uniref:Carbamoyltransferase n=1 Tax=Amycolatopsis pithecellobii TaxID=664692 RepID=A0A6N7Z3I1_9PSEU|nr:carbamoyltransferase C-terminal domain-containing protein [Amycolatopsis pithecellobii]MTD55689.1 carbamoyltransferase [Amycolatopsis pithecellobii]